jgi:hypothetical protein
VHWSGKVLLDLRRKKADQSVILSEVKKVLEIRKIKG